MIEKEPRRGVGDPAPGGGRGAFCDRMNSWAQARASPASATSSGARRGRLAAGPLAKNLGRAQGGPA
jgi:aspartyl-tRNA synthetase